MITVKDTQRATVQVCFDGSVRKVFHGPKARDRFANEVRVLRHLEQAGCDFVPRVISTDPKELLLVTSNCGSRVDQLDEGRCQELFDQLEEYGVRHDDADIRNITYNQQLGRFCLIDFEFATLLDKGTPHHTRATSNSPEILTIRLAWSGCSDQGPVRANNEDSFLGLSIDPREVHHLGRSGSGNTGPTDLLFAVSDGMGGAQAGEFASKIAVEKITRRFPPLLGQRGKGLPIVYQAAFEAVYAEINKALQYLGESYEECNGMGATLSICWFSDDTMHFAHIGDTRIYHLPGGATGGIRQLTEDDTHVGWLYRTGQLSERDAKMHPAKNRLQKALGGGNQFVTPQCGEVSCKAGDRFLLCTDGVTDALYDMQLREILDDCPKGHSPAHHLVKVAIERSGRDNTTAMVITVE